VIFSVVVPVYNDQERLEKCLKSLKKQTLTEYFEILVIDNGSDEDISKFMDSWHQLPDEYRKTVNEKWNSDWQSILKLGVFI